MLGQELKVTDRRHPPGETGVRTSLEQVAKLISDGGRHPKVVAWAREQLERGRRQLGWKMGTDRERAAVLLRAVQKKLWIPDPVATEFMAGAHLLACDKSTKDELCMVSGDCDELAGLLGASLLAVGIDTMVVGHGYRENRISHVLVAARVDGSWQYADPSTDLPLGKCVRFERERILSVPNVQVLCDDKSCLSDKTAYNPNDHDFAVEGYFVGVDGVPRFSWIVESSLAQSVAPSDVVARCTAGRGTTKDDLKGAAGCAADIYCATYGVPPGICGGITESIANAIDNALSAHGGLGFEGLINQTMYLHNTLLPNETKFDWVKTVAGQGMPLPHGPAGGPAVAGYYVPNDATIQAYARTRQGYHFTNYDLSQGPVKIPSSFGVANFNLQQDISVRAAELKARQQRTAASPKKSSANALPKLAAVGALGLGVWWLWLR